MKCARCGKYLKDHETTGESAIYNPTGPKIILCEGCFFDEDAEIEEAGTNNLPDTLKRYNSAIKGEK